MSEAEDVLDFLRVRFTRLDEGLDRIDRKLDEVVTRLGALERKVAGIELDYAAIQQRLDNVDRRLDGIERRLDLVDGIGTPRFVTRPHGTIPGSGSLFDASRSRRRGHRMRRTSR
jgi:tetrahydromethanopterin S-methyltransferase subunit G